VHDVVLHPKEVPMRPYALIDGETVLGAAYDGSLHVVEADEDRLRISTFAASELSFRRFVENAQSRRLRCSC
jgi:hypothetical protein